MRSVVLTRCPSKKFGTLTQGGDGQPDDIMPPPQASA